jgi:hypothetical protein
MDEFAGAAEIRTLLDRYLLGLDEGVLDDAWAWSLFTENACVEFPMSRHVGVDGMARYHRATLANFTATQHLGSTALVELAGDRATLRANLISTHVHLPANAAGGPLFATGTLVTGEALRTAEGWRLHQLSFRLLWTTGTPPPAAAS